MPPTGVSSPVFAASREKRLHTDPFLYHRQHPAKRRSLLAIKDQRESLELQLHRRISLFNFVPSTPVSNLDLSIHIPVSVLNGPLCINGYALRDSRIAAKYSSRSACSVIPSVKDITGFSRAGFGNYRCCGGSRNAFGGRRRTTERPAIKCNVAVHFAYMLTFAVVSDWVPGT